MELDKDRLAKLLNLTESDQDGEALAAIRKANDLLRQCNAHWPSVLGIVEPASEEEAAPEPSEPPTPGPRPATAAAAEPPRPPPMPPGYMRARAYSNAFHREPLLPRLLGFPFWILVECMAIGMPNKVLTTRGAGLAFVFTLSMILGILGWIGLGFYLVFGLDY